MDSVARPACCWLIVARHFARHSCTPLSRAPLPFRVPFPPVVPVRCAPWPSPVVGGLVARQGWGGGGARRWLWSLSPGVSPRGGRCMHSPSGCNSVVRAVHLYPHQYKWTCVVTRYVGPSPHRGRVHCGSLGSPCGIGTSLAYPDGRCALPAAPHRTRTVVRAVGSALGQAHWPPPQAGATSGRWPTVPGVTHLIACAQVGPIRTPGGPPNPRGRVPHQRLSRALVTPAPRRSLRCLSLPSCFRPQGRPPVPRPLPCPLAPAMPRLPLLSAPALACWCPLLFFFFFPALPHVPSLSPRCHRPFRGWVED